MTAKHPENIVETDLSGLVPKGQPGSSDYFTGTAWVTPLLVRHEIDNVANVDFDAGARTRGVDDQA